MDFISLFEKMIYYVANMGLKIPFYALVLSSAGVYLILFILQGIGLYRMAEKRNLTNKWQAFVPFANTYLIGRLAGECSFGAKKIKRIKIWLVITEILAFLSAAAYLVFQTLAIYTDLFADVIYIQTDTIYGVEIKSIHFTNWLEVFNNVMPLVSQLFDLLFFVFFIIALVSLFRRYSARNGLTITMWCIVAEIFFGIPIHGVFIFAMRNNKEMDYNEYIRKKQAAFMRQQNPYQNARQNPYDYYSRRNSGSQNPPSYNYDPYTGKPLHQEEKPASTEEPFSEFGGGSEEKSDSKSDTGDDSFSF